MSAGAGQGTPRPPWALSPRGPLQGPCSPLAELSRKGNSSWRSQRFRWKLGRNIQSVAPGLAGERLGSGVVPAGRPRP